jgi:HlyD family secretion protein
MTTRKKLSILLGAAGVLAALAAGLLWLRAARERASAPRLDTARLDRGDVVVRVAATGTLSARTTVLVSSQVSGRVTEVLVDYNSPVRKGQLLARIDPQPFQAQVAQSEASTQAAQAALEKARASVADLERKAARKDALAARALVAAEERETAEADLAKGRAEVSAAAAALAQARAALTQARYNLSVTAIRAPIDGIVVSRAVDAGQTVAASLSAPTLFTLAEDLRSMRLESHVSEGDVSRIAEGMPVSFTVAGLPGETLAGVVRQVRNAAETVENVVTYDVVADVENPSLRLRPGMTATASFTVAERRGVLRAPAAALRYRPAGEAAVPARAGATTRTLHVVEGAALRPVEVQVGVSDGSFTEIASGDVAAGAVIAIGAGGTAARAAQRQQAGAPPPPRMF